MTAQPLVRPMDGGQSLPVRRHGSKPDDVFRKFLIMGGVRPSGQQDREAAPRSLAELQGGPEAPDVDGAGGQACYGTR